MNKVLPYTLIIITAIISIVGLIIVQDNIKIKYEPTELTRDFDNPEYMYNLIDNIKAAK